MGWLFGWDSKDAAIADQLKPWTSDGKRSECVAQCYRGGRSGGVVWAVWAITDTETTKIVDQFIVCYLIKVQGHEWGVKSLEESSGPYYYSCPLKYLDMVPVPKSGHAPKWREQVRAYHAVRNRKLTKGATYEAAGGLRLNGSRIARIRVDSLRPIRGTIIFESGATMGGVKFKRKMVLEEVTV